MQPGGGMLLDHKTQFLARRHGPRAAGLGAAEHPLVGGGSDANTVAAVGIAAIDGLGPRGEGFHTRNEWVDLASFRPKAEALARFLWQRLAATEGA